MIGQQFPEKQGQRGFSSTLGAVDANDDGLVSGLFEAVQVLGQG